MLYCCDKNEHTFGNSNSVASIFIWTESGAIGWIMESKNEEQIGRMDNSDGPIHRPSDNKLTTIWFGCGRWIQQGQLNKLSSGSIQVLYTCEVIDSMVRMITSCYLTLIEYWNGYIILQRLKRSKFNETALSKWNKYKHEWKENNFNFYRNIRLKSTIW